MSRHSLLKPSFALGMIAAALQTQAQPRLEEIVVTADFRGNTIDELAASVSVLDQELIANRNALHLEDVLANAPNVNFASGASRARFYQIRGIGERGQYTEPMNPSVGVLIDGVDFSGIGGAAMLYDVEQVEILMGPQGTRYGSNALAGLINLQSKAPTEQLAYGLQLQAENYDGQGLAGYLSGPLGDTLQGRLSAQKLESDGFNENLTLGRPTNYRDETTVRGKLSWQATDTLNIDLSLARIDIDNGYDAFSLDNIRDTLSDEPGFDRQRSDLASVQLSSDAFDSFTLELTGGFAGSDIGYGYDEDWTYTGFHPWEYSSTDYYFRDRSTHSVELRLLSRDAGALFDGRTDWVIGAYRLDQQVDLERIYTYLPASFFSSYEIERSALYGDAETRLSDNWSLETGLRIERFSARYDDSDALQFDPSDTLGGGRIALNYLGFDSGLVYASVSRGYKTGGFNTDGSLDADLREYGEETLLNYELGYKGVFLDDSLHTRMALFYMDRDEVQISSSTVRMRDDGSAEFIDFTGNAAAGFNRGLELAATWYPNELLTLYGNLGLLDSEYRDFINSAGDNLDGRQQAHAPDYQYTLGASLQLAPTLSADINVQGRDSFYFSDSHDVRSDSYALLNLSLSWQWDSTTLRLWARNLNDRDYAVRGFYFGNDPRDNYTAKGYTQFGEPRRYGLTLNFDF